MSLYIVIFIFLAIAAAHEFFKGKTIPPLFIGMFSVLALFLCLRHGQGTDYFGYNINFNITPSLYQWDLLWTSDVHGEIGWFIINSLLRTIKIPFEVLAIAVSVFELVCMYRFINKHAKYKTVTLFLLYSVYFLTYAMSALRQGIAIFFFIGFLFDWYLERKYLRYILCAFALALIHSSALMLLVPFVARLFPLDTKKSIFYMVSAFVLGLICRGVFSLVIPVFKTYVFIGFNILALLERIITMTVILLLLHNKLDDKEDESPVKVMLQFYVYAVVFYLFFSWNALIASRFGVYFKVFEVVLLSLGLSEQQELRSWLKGIPALKLWRFNLKGISFEPIWKKIPEKISAIKVKYIVAAFCVLLTSIMFFKNMNAYLYEGNYNKNVNVWNYPYCTIFDREEIFSYREVPYNSYYLLNGWKEDVKKEHVNEK